MSGEKNKITNIYIYIYICQVEKKEKNNDNIKIYTYVSGIFGLLFITNNSNGETNKPGITLTDYIVWKWFSSIDLHVIPKKGFVR